MAAYSTIDYLPDLTLSEMPNAGILNFTTYSVPSVGWDFMAMVYGSDSYALLHDTYSFTAIEGATYDIFSTSYFDPYILMMYDQFGNAIAANNESDDGSDILLSDGYYSQDIIYNWVAPYTGTYYVSASWNQGIYYKYYSLSVYEDVGTAIADKIAPTVALTSSQANLGVGNVAKITFSLSEPSTNFTVADIDVTGGVLSNFTGSGTSYSVLFTPYINSTTNAVVRVASGKFSDGAGNLNTDGADGNNVVTMSVNTTTPSPPINESKNNTLDILVDRGVLAKDPVLLKGLSETITYQNGVISSHTITYGSAVFDYLAIDSLIFTIVRNGEFTQEFAQEVKDFLPSAAGITYHDAALLVGIANIDSVIIAISGADGNYVS